MDPNSPQRFALIAAAGGAVAIILIGCCGFGLFASFLVSRT